MKKATSTGAKKINSIIPCLSLAFSRQNLAAKAKNCPTAQSLRGNLSHDATQKIVMPASFHDRLIDRLSLEQIHDLLGEPLPPLKERSGRNARESRSAWALAVLASTIHLSSPSTCRYRTMPISSTTGASARHGPHSGGPESTSTGCSDCQHFLFELRVAYRRHKLSSICYSSATWPSGRVGVFLKLEIQSISS